MTVCETCGDEGFSQLLFYCLKCQIVAVHRYCMNGPPVIDDEEISWYCDECVPVVPEPPEPSQEYDQQENGVPSNDQQENEVPLTDQKENGVPLGNQQENAIHPSDQQVVSTSDKEDDGFPPSDQQENSNEKNSPFKHFRGGFKTNASDISQRKDESSLSQCDPVCSKALDDAENIRPIVLALKSVEPCDKTTDTEKGRYKRGRPCKKKEDLLYGTIVRKMRSKRARSHRDVEEEEVKLENNVVLEVADSVILKDGKHEKSCNEADSIQAMEHSDYADQEPEVVEEEIVSVHDDKSEDVQSSCTIRKSCSPRKKRSLIIEMEYSDEDGDDDTNNALTVLSPLKSSNDSEMFCASNKRSLIELGSDHHAPPMMVPDYNLTPSAPLNLPACVPYPPCSSQILDYVPSQPVIDVIWRGGCVIGNNIDPTSFKLEAHVSNKASAVVFGAAIALPQIIDFEIISKRFAWPKSFKKSPPTGESIGLYFFPVGERDEVVYQNLLAKMVDRQLMMMSQINNVELLVFCSQELPEEERRFQRKYYLWGVFRSKQETTFPMKPLDQRVGVNYSLSLPSDTPRDDVHQKPRDPNHRTADNLNHPDSVSGSQTSDTRLDRGQSYGSHKRRSYHHEFKEHRSETSYQSEAQRRPYRIRESHAIAIRSAHNDSYRSGGRFRHFRGHERYDR